MAEIAAPLLTFYVRLQIPPVPPPPPSAHGTICVREEAPRGAELSPEQFWTKLSQILLQRLAEYESIAKQLKNQIERASTHATHFKAHGDVKNAVA